MQQRFVSAGGLRVRLLDQPGPSGAPALLCLHGFTGRAETFARLMARYGAHYRCVAPDLRGHGWSDRAASYRITDYVQDQLALIDALGLEQVLVYGHSLGGLVAMALAAERPGRISACMAEDPPLFHRTRSVADLPHLARFAAQHAARQAAEQPMDLLHGLEQEFPDEDSVWHVRMAERLWTCDPAIWTPILEDRLYEGVDIDALFAAIRCPVLLLQGDPAEGAVLFDDDVSSIRQVLPDCRVVRFPGAGHRIREEDLDGVLAAVEEFLGSLAPPA